VSAGLFEGYDPGEFFDEAMEGDGLPRPHYRTLVNGLGVFTPHQLAERERVRDAAFRQAGITFTVYGEGEGVERTFPWTWSRASSRPTSGPTSRRGSCSASPR
jgi:uncharacterized circularly permuted ATP-grasp superfamily protein